MGATFTLSPDRQQVFAVDMSLPAAQLAAAVERLLVDNAAVQRVSANAMQAARAYDEVSNASKLLQLVNEVLH